MPRGSPAKAWPLQPLVPVEGRERTPLDVLREIIDRAERRAPDPDALRQLALACIANTHEPPIDDEEHAEFIRQAQEAARHGRWDLAVEMLEHRHRTESKEKPMPTPWPNYPANDPYWDKLREIVLLAHLGCPANLIAPIIRLAFKCAANAHATLPHSHGTTAAQDAHVTTALAHAQAATTPQDWQLVYDELNHD